MKCKHCQEEVSVLHNVQSGIKTFVMDKSGEYDEGDECDFEPDGETNEWICPECLEKVADTEEEAIKLLKA